MNARIITVPREGCFLKHLSTVLMDCVDDNESFVIACGVETLDHVPEEFREFAAPLLVAYSKPDSFRRVNHLRNYARCLRDVKGAVLIAEDDVLVTRNFKKKLSECISKCDDITERYVLSLYFTGHLSEKPVEHVDPLYFYGSQLMYYPASVIQDVSACFDKEVSAEEVRWLGADCLVSEWLINTNTPLFCASPSLAQHRGRKSTGMSLGFHSSPSFVL